MDHLGFEGFLLTFLSKKKTVLIEFNLWNDFLLINEYFMRINDSSQKREIIKQIDQ